MCPVWVGWKSAESWWKVPESIHHSQRENKLHQHGSDWSSVCFYVCPGEGWKCGFVISSMLMYWECVCYWATASKPLHGFMFWHLLRCVFSLHPAIFKESESLKWHRPTGVAELWGEDPFRDLPKPMWFPRCQLDTGCLLTGYFAHDSSYLSLSLSMYGWAWPCQVRRAWKAYSLLQPVLD